MGLGREVADAYIEVHGDLSKFRNSLNKAAIAGRKEGMEAADSFMEGWEKRAKADFGKKYEGILDAAFSNKKLDWDRLLGTFDAKGFDDASNKITTFLEKAREDGKITENQFKKSSAAIRGTMDLMEQQHKQALKDAEEQKTLREKELAHEQARQWELAKTRGQQERYNESFAGMFRANKLKDLEADFKRVTAAMSDMDWSKFSDGEKNLNQIPPRVREVITHMKDLGRVSEVEGDRIVKSLREHIREEERRRSAVRLTTEETRKAKEEQDRYKRSLEGMVEAARLHELEDGYKKIARAMGTHNWGPVSKDYQNMRQFTDGVRGTAAELRRTGLIGEAEFERINSSINSARRSTGAWGVEFESATNRGGGGISRMQKITNSFRKSWARMDGTVKMVLIGIAAAAGPLAALLSGAAASGTALVSSLGMAVAALIPLAAGVVALGVGIGLAVTAMDGMKATFPGIQRASEAVGATWKANAKNFGDQWGASLERVLTSFSNQLAKYDFGTPLGKAFSVITDSFNDVVNGPAFAAFMRAMETDLPDAVAGLGKGFAGLFSGLLSLMAGAAPAAKALGEDFAGWGEKIAKSLEKARESGKLNEVFMKARESLLAVLDLTGSVGKALGTMFMIGSDSGNRMLRSMAGITDQFTAWMQTEAGRAKMTEWFENGERIMRSLEPVAVGLGKALGGLVNDASITQLENFMKSLGDFLPLLGEVLQLTTDLHVLEILGAALDVVRMALEPLLPPIRDLAKAIGPVLLQLVKALGPVFEDLAVALAPILEDIVKLVSELLPVLLPYIVDLVGDFAELVLAVLDLVEVFTDFFASMEPITGGFNLWERWGDVLGGVIDGVTSVVKILTGILTGDFSLALEGIKGGLEGWQRSMTGSETGLQDLATEAGNWARDLPGKIGQGLVDTSVEMAKGWDGMKEDARIFGEDVKAGLAQSWAINKENASREWNEMTANIGTAMDTAGGYVNTKLDGFWTKFDEIFPGTRQLAEEEWQWMTESIGTKTQEMQDTVGGILDGLKANSAENWEQISTDASNNWEALKILGALKWDEITASIAKPIDDFKAGNAKAWEEVSTAAQTIWDDMKGKGGAAFTVLKNEVSTKTNETKTNMQQNWDKISGYLGTTWDGITGKGAAGAGTLQSKVSAEMGTLESKWNATWTVVGNYLGNAWNRMLETIRTKIQEVMEFFITLPRRITTALQNLPETLKQAGRDMINGFKLGIQEMARNITRAAQDVAQGAIDGVKNLLRINSPSKVFMEIGGSVGEGMVMGIDKGAPGVAAAASSMAMATTAEFSASKMYVAGQEAAAGLAKGLLESKGSISSAFSAMQAGVSDIGVKVNGSGANSGEAAGGGIQKQININEGAITLQTQTTDPKLSADILLDELVTHHSMS